MDYTEDKLPGGLDAITAAELAEDDVFVLGDKSEDPAYKMKGILKSELSILSKDALSNNLVFGVSAPYQNGVDYLIGFNGYRIFSTGNTFQNKLYAFPSFERKGSVIDALAVRRNGAYGQNATRVGIYSDLGTNRLPNALLADCGSKNTNDGGVHYWTESPLPFTIPVSGIYWFVFETYNGASFKSCTTGPGDLFGYNNPHLGGDDFTAIMCLHASFTYGALPETFPAPSIVLQTSPPPCLYKRYSAV